MGRFCGCRAFYLVAGQVTKYGTGLLSWVSQKQIAVITTLTGERLPVNTLGSQMTCFQSSQWEM